MDDSWENLTEEIFNYCESNIVAFEMASDSVGGKAIAASAKKLLELWKERASRLRERG